MASITSNPIGTIPDLYPSAGLFSTQHLVNPYGTYDVTVHFTNNQGKIPVPLGLPVGSTANSLAIIDIHAPTCIKVVDWKCTREALLPLVPSSIPTDSNLVLLANDYWPLKPETLPDGATKLYGFAGVYSYALLKPTAESAGFDLVFTPDQLNTGERFDGANFVSTIIP